MLRLRTFGTTAAIAIGLVTTPTMAHPKLLSASLAADASGSTARKVIKLSFSEGVIAKFSGVELTDESGKTVSSGVPVTDPKDQKQLIVPLPEALAPGRYTVNWHAVSEDTHRVKGQYSLTINR